ncbi:hypothetical protein EV641_103200 [Rhodococcus sp. SMB37]|uniref:hypothetical protein n=1 Tax=Rhodococcus sp. SMB37 TaxID=2512213 RepID=UPI0010D652A2|nr:hypothetical protein [Rhodococcus sp. SMB37]TCN55853.1 hypothetical protein EV641_103200 [Rhodococcus sp. SMB37]
MIELSPVGCRALFGMPAAELWDGSFESADVLGQVGDELWERLQSPAGRSERFEVCDRVLLRLLREKTVARELAATWQGIVECGGALPVSRFAALLQGWADAIVADDADRIALLPSPTGSSSGLREARSDATRSSRSSPPET